MIRPGNMMMTDQSKYTASDCARRYGVTRAEWYKMVERGEAPRPTHQHPRKVWAINVLIAWEENVLAACDEVAC